MKDFGETIKSIADDTMSSAETEDEEQDADYVEE